MRKSEYSSTLPHTDKYLRINLPLFLGTDNLVTCTRLRNKLTVILRYKRTKILTVHVGNIILRGKDNSPVLMNGGAASFRVSDRPLQERWNDDDICADFHKGIRVLLRKGVYYQGPDNDPIYPAFSAGGVWDRFRTPLSNEQQVQLIQEMRQ